MKRIPLQETAAVICLAGIGLGVAVEIGVGWALVVVCVLALGYILLPDQRSAQ